MRCAAAGDARTLAVLNGWINEIAQGLAGLVHIFNPQPDPDRRRRCQRAAWALLIDPLAEGARQRYITFAEGWRSRLPPCRMTLVWSAVYYFREMHER
ncbi:MAG: hypothetical protein ACLUGI_11440 [Subdoligranulum sp.]